jgi:hypothetical protein
MKRISGPRRSLTNASPSETRVYRTHSDRQRAVKQMARRSTFNYFVLYLDTQGLAIACGVAVWVGPRGNYIDW